MKGNTQSPYQHVCQKVTRLDVQHYSCVTWFMSRQGIHVSSIVPVAGSDLRRAAVTAVRRITPQT
eukprot:1294408-Amphidinium_carterae.1